MNIHMGWVGSEPPRHVLDAVARVRQIAPDCEVMFHTDDPGGNFTPHMRSDIQRHVVLERYGGLWLDADTQLRVSPTQWASGWSNYTAIKMVDGLPPIGTDIIYVPQGWAGWPIVRAYIEGFLQNTPPVFSKFVLAADMLRTLSRKHGDQFSILPAGSRFPGCVPETSETLVVRRCVMAAPPGLGDMVAAGLSAVGITKDRVQAVAQAVGVKDCGCPGRQAALNRLGAKLGLPPGTTAAS